MSFYLRKCVLILKDTQNYYRINGGGGIDKTRVSAFNDIVYEARVGFEISKDKEDIYMSAEFNIYGLDIQAIKLDLGEKKENQLIFYAGYDDTDFDEKGEPLSSPIFIGRVFHMEQANSNETILNIYATISNKTSDKVPFFSMQKQIGGITYYQVIQKLQKELADKKKILLKLDFDKTIEEILKNKKNIFSKSSYATNPSQDLRDYMNYLCNNLSSLFFGDNIKWYMDFTENVERNGTLPQNIPAKYSIHLYKDIQEVSKINIATIHRKDLIAGYDDNRERDYRENFYREKVGGKMDFTIKKINEEDLLKTKKIISIIRNDISLDKQIVFIDTYNDNKPTNYAIDAIKYTGDTHKNDDSWKITLELKKLN